MAERIKYNGAVVSTELRTSGWYRIAVFEDRSGSGIVNLNNYYANDMPKASALWFDSKGYLKLLSEKRPGGVFQTARVVKSNEVLYIEVYYTSSKMNAVFASFSSLIGIIGVPFQPSDGGTVVGAELSLTD